MPKPLKRQAATVRQLGRLVRGVDLGILRGLESLLVRTTPAEIGVPFLAVCGAPRSGHSLTTQVITQALRVVMVDNLQYVFFRTPLIGYLLSRLVTKPYVSDYRSSRGYVRGLNGPQEGPLLWNYWCDMYEEERPPRPDPARMRKFGRLLNRIYAIDGRPYCATYVGHSFYFDALAALFRRHVFIRCRRDMLSTAVSIATFTRDEQGNYATFWMSTRPYECQDPVLMARLSPYERVARQVYFVNRRLDEQAATGRYAVFDSEYRDLCADPRAVMARLIAFAAERGIALEPRRDVELPRQFNATGARRHDDRHTAEIAAAFDRLRDEFGPLSVPIESD
jgi:hypothetical protein